MTRASSVRDVVVSPGRLVALSDSGEVVVGAAVVGLVAEFGPVDGGSPPSTVQAASTSKDTSKDRMVETYRWSLAS
jgi:hypothetical protein